MFDNASRALSWAHLNVIRLQGSAQVAILRLQHGQGLAEYALILALIAILPSSPSSSSAVRSARS
jgi:hypothetical protein